VAGGVVTGRSRCVLGLTVAVVTACPPPSGSSSGAAVPPAVDATRDTVAGTIPAGFGTMRQEEVAITIQTGRLLVRAIPLEESIIRVLAPDSYGSLRGRRESERDRIDMLARQAGVERFSVWSVEFYAIEPDVRFSPSDVVISSAGRDFRPVQVIPLTAGFGQHRLQQRERQSALYLFDAAVDVNQPLVLTVESVRNTRWLEIVQSIERERARVRSKAGTAIPPR
jgi:hypothetical protein